MKDRLTWSNWLTIVGIAVAVANMALAWIVLLITPAGGFDPSQISSILQQSLSSTDVHALPSDASLSALFNTLTKLDVFHSQLSFHRLVIILGLAFTLMAMGFSFFVMGTESALRVRGSANDFGWIVVKATSPG